MRKIKIFLTTLAIAGVLFATSSCVDNTESESVSALRNAKATELTANAEYLKAKGEAEKALADAQKAFAAAEQTLANAQIDYLAALGRADEARAEAAKMEADAQKIRATAEGEAANTLAQAQRDFAAAEQTLANAQTNYLNAKGDAEKELAAAAKLEAEAQKNIAQARLVSAKGDSIKAAAEAKRLEAEADRITKETQIKVDSAEAALEVTLAQNEVAIAKAQEQLNLVAEKARLQLLQIQQQYVTALATLQAEVAVEYGNQSANLLDVLAAIAAEEKTIAEAEITKASIDVAVAKLVLDTAKFIKSAVADINAGITKDNLALKYAQRELAFWEAFDGGKAALEEELAGLIADTLRTRNDLNAAEVKRVEEYVADTVAKKQALAAVTPAYDEALEKKAKYNQDYLDADKAYNDYLDVTASPSSYYWDYVGSYVDLVYPFQDIIYSFNNVGDPQGPYDLNGDGSILHYYGYIYIDDNYRLTVDRYVYSWTPDEYVGWQLDQKRYYSYQEYDAIYSSLPVLHNAIEYKKLDTTDKGLYFKTVTIDLDNSLDSLKKYDPLKLSTDLAYQAAVKVVTAANDANNAAQATWLAARAVIMEKLNDDDDDTNPTKDDTLKLREAAAKYNHTNEHNAVLPDFGGTADISTGTALTKAIDAKDKAYNAWSNASGQFDYWNGQVKNNISYRISAKNNYDQSVEELKALEALVDIVATGTRDKLYFDLQNKEKISNDYLASDEYATALKAHDDATEALKSSKEAYDGYVGVNGEFGKAELNYATAKIEYRKAKFIEVQIDLGGKQALLDKKADKISAKIKAIAGWEENIKKAEAKLASITAFATVDDPIIKEGIVLYETIDDVLKHYADGKAAAQATIDAANAQIAELNKQKDYYQSAIDALLAYDGE